MDTNKATRLTKIQMSMLQLAARNNRLYLEDVRSGDNYPIRCSAWWHTCSSLEKRGYLKRACYNNNTLMAAFDVTEAGRQAIS